MSSQKAGGGQVSGKRSESCRLAAVGGMATSGRVLGAQAVEQDLESGGRANQWQASKNQAGSGQVSRELATLRSRQAAKQTGSGSE